MFELIKKELRKYASRERKNTNEYFFKTAVGQYGYGDVFIGVSVPDCREIAKLFRGVPLSTVRKLLSSKIHEERLVALEILVFKMQMFRGETPKHLDGRRELRVFYLKNLKGVNSWDLVDASAPPLLC